MQYVILTLSSVCIPINVYAQDQQSVHGQKFYARYACSLYNHPLGNFLDQCLHVTSWYIPGYI